MTAYLLTMSYRKPFGFILSAAVSLWRSGKIYGCPLISRLTFGIKIFVKKLEYDGFRIYSMMSIPPSGIWEFYKLLVHSHWDLLATPPGSYGAVHADSLMRFPFT